MSLEEMNKKYDGRDIVGDLEKKESLKEKFPYLTTEILNEYGPAIIKYLENGTNLLWEDNWNDGCLLKYLIKPEINRLDLIAKMGLVVIFPKLTEEILNEYGPAIIKYLENETSLLWGDIWADECLLKYLMKPEINRLDLIAKMKLKNIFPELTEEVLKKYEPAIIKYLERVRCSPWNDDYLLKYLMKPEINRLDLIAKMSLEVIFPELTEETLKEYGPVIIKYLEKVNIHLGMMSFFLNI